MADNYSQFSEHWTFTSPKAAVAAELFCNVARACQLIACEDYDGEEADGEFLDSLAPQDSEAILAFRSLSDEAIKTLADHATDYGMDFDCERDDKDPGTVWVYSDEGGDLDGAAEVARAVLDAVGEHDTVFTGTSAQTCSKLRLGEFGGGWVAVSSKEIRGGSTWGAAEDAAKAMRAAK